MFVYVLSSYESDGSTTMYSVVIVHCGVIKISEIRIFCIDYSQRIDFLFSLLFM